MNSLLNSAVNLYNNPFISSLCVPAVAGRLLMPAMTIIHEMGHALAYKILYKNAHPTISLRSYGYLGGETFPNFSGVPRLSLTGRLFRPAKADMIVSAAGPIAELITNLAVINGFNSSMRYPLLICSTSDSAAYAWKPLIESNKPNSNDFQNIKRISPLFYKTLLGGSTGMATYIFAKAFGNLVALKS